MTHGVIMDTGPLAAYFLQQQPHHEWAASQFDRMSGQLLTCETVLTETCYLISRGRVPADRLLRKVVEGTIEIAFQFDTEARASPS